MDLRLVEYFVAVVDHRGVTRAADALYIAQPSLSQAMRTLEREIGADLFDRSGRSLTLTDTGRDFELAARRVLADAESARGHVAAVRDLTAGSLRISAVADVTIHPLPELVRRFAATYPDVQILISDPGPADGAVVAVRQGDTDLGLITLQVKAESLTVLPLAPQRMVLAMTPPLAQGLPDPVPQGRLSDLPLIRSPEDGLSDLVADPQLLGPPGDARLISTFRQVTWELVMLGAGMALLPEGIVRSQLTGVVTRRLDPDIRREVAVICRIDQLSPAAAAFLEPLGRD